MKDSDLTKHYRSLNLPITHETYLEGHERAVCSIVIQKKGIRMLTGSWDSDVRMWDFYTMRKNMDAFRVLTPIDNHVI